MYIKKGSVFIIMLSIFVVEYSTYFVTSDLLDKTLKFGLLILFWASIKSFKFQRDQKKLILIYCLLFGCAACGSLTALDPVGLVQLVKFATMFSFLPVILLKYSKENEVPVLLLKVPLFWGIVFSIQSFILYFVILWDLPIEPIWLNDLDRMPGMVEKSYGILGYANAIVSVPSGARILRAQGWFLEPSNLAAFLCYPLFVSFGYFLSTKKMRYLLFFLLIGFCFFTTYSLAGYFGILAGVTFLILLRLFKRFSNKGVLSYVFIALGALIFLISAQYIMSKLQNLAETGSEMTVGVKAFARDKEGDSGTLMRKGTMPEEAFAIVKQNPFGIGLGFTLGVESPFKSGNALLMWAAASGITGVITILLLYLTLIKSYAIPLLQSDSNVYKYIAASFIAITVQNLGYGNWMEPYYLYNVAVMILCHNQLRKAQLANIGYNLYAKKEDKNKRRVYKIITY